MTPIDGRELTLDYDIPFFWETSAVENQNIQMVFADMARKIALTYLVRPTVMVVKDGPNTGSPGSLKQREMSTLENQTRTIG